MMRNARQEYVITRILSVSHIKTYHSAVDPKLRTVTVSFGKLPLVTLSYLSHSAYFYLYTQIVVDSCEWLISYADKYVLLRPLRWMMKPLATGMSILGQVWCLNVSIHDLCPLYYFQLSSFSCQTMC